MTFFTAEKWALLVLYSPSVSLWSGSFMLVLDTYVPIPSSWRWIEPTLRIMPLLMPNGLHRIMLLRFTTVWNTISVYHQEEMSSQAACCKHLLPSPLSCFSGFSFSSTITDSLTNKLRLSVDFKLDDGLSDSSVKRMSQIEFGFFWHSHWFFYFLNCCWFSQTAWGSRLSAPPIRKGLAAGAWLRSRAPDLVLRHRPGFSLPGTSHGFSRMEIVFWIWKHYLSRNSKIFAKKLNHLLRKERKKNL